MSLTIYAAITVPTHTPHPSNHCLQWSADGQLILLTKNAVYILTPAPGITFDIASAVKNPVAATQRVGTAAAPPLGMFRTMLEFEKGVLHHWPVDCQDWSAVSLGSLDVSLRAVTCSPSGLTAEARCVLAVLNSNMELSIWGAVKNHLRGEWVKLEDVTASLNAEAESVFGTQSTLARTLRMQLTCIAWASQPDFGIRPVPVLDGSLLAAGSRSGSVIFLRARSADDSGNTMKFVGDSHVGDKWVTHVAWTSWVSAGPGRCSATLACGCSDGSVRLVNVVQFLREIPSAAKFCPAYGIDASFEAQGEVPREPDGRSLTAIAWIEASGTPILVFCKPGTVHLWTAASTVPGTGWSGSRTFLLKTQHLSAGSSALHPASGISYMRHKDAVVISLFDGSFHVINNISTEPTLKADTSNTDTGFSTERLSAISRSVFVQCEGEAPNGLSDDSKLKEDVNRISGMIPYASGSSTISWIHESSRPLDFSYKHDARHSSMLVVAQMWEDPSVDTVLQDFRELLTSPKASADAPLALLRLIFLHLRQPGKVADVSVRLLELLRPADPDDWSAITVDSRTGDMRPEFRADFRRSLSAHIFGWEAMLSYRLKLSVATYAQERLANVPQNRSDFDQVSILLSNAIYYRILCTLVRHIAAVASVITEDDLPIVMRVILQSLFPGCPPMLSTEAQSLMDLVSAKIPADPLVPFESHGYNERCPACSAEIKFQNIVDAECPNGHIWGRCSITTFIIATPMVRTCIGCSRKAFLPASISSQNGRDHLPVSARSWIVEELLEASSRCLFCGNAFVVLV